MKPNSAFHSNLKDIARQIGHIVPEPIDTAYGTNLQNVISNMKLHEAWDALEAMKKLVTDDRKGQKVRAMLEQHPNLIHAMYEIQVRPLLPLPCSLANALPNISLISPLPLCRNAWGLSCRRIFSSSKCELPQTRNHPRTPPLLQELAAWVQAMSPIRA